MSEEKPYSKMQEWAKKLSTSTKCPKCGNDDVYLVHCHRSIWKGCDKCKSVFFCEDASGGTFTDWDMKKYFEEHPGKSIEDYKTMKLEWIENKFKDYSHQDHPLVTE